MKETELIRKIADAMSGVGYEVTVGPSSILNRRMWQFDLPSLIRGLKYRPDLIVQNGDDFAVVEVKTRPFLFGGVIQARNYSQYFGAPTIVCVPDDIVPEIPASVMRFAGEEEIQVCSFSELTGALKTHLSTPQLQAWNKL